MEQFEQERQEPLTETAQAPKKSWVEELYEWAESIIIVPVIVVLLFAFFARTSQVSGSSMLDTLHHGEMLVVSNFLYTPQYGDIVVLTQPTFSYDPIVKRVIATEGQRVNIDFEKGVVYVDGVELDEPYTYTPTNVELDTLFPQTVKPGHVFVMGDNRNGSTDSRAASIGQIDTRKLLGRAYVRILPLDKIANLMNK